MDIIEEVPKYEGKDIVMVAVYQYAKYDHFWPLAHPFLLQGVTRVFMDHIC